MQLNCRSGLFCREQNILHLRHARRPIIPPSENGQKPPIPVENKFCGQWKAIICAAKKIWWGERPCEPKIKMMAVCKDDAAPACHAPTALRVQCKSASVICQIFPSKTAKSFVPDMKLSRGFISVNFIMLPRFSAV